MTKVRCTIRINGDGSSDTVIPEQAVAPVDDDWIEVELTIGADDDLTYQLRRMTTDLNVYRGDTREEFVFDEEYMGTGNLVYTFADASEVPDSVWVEWTSDAHSNPPDPNNHYFGPQLVLQALVDPNHVGIRTEDVLVFHTFHSMVMVIGGRTSNPFDPNGWSGVYEIAKQLYQRGWDAHIYAENKDDDEFDDSTPPQIDWRDGVQQVANAVTTRGVEEIAIIGYSRGGGAAYEAAKRLVEDHDLGNFIAYTAYLDAVHWGGWHDLDELPPSTQYHVNFYQTYNEGWGITNGIVGIDGAPVEGADVNVDVNEQSWVDPGTWLAPQDDGPSSGGGYGVANDGIITHGEIALVPQIYDAIIIGSSTLGVEGIEQRLTR